MPNLVSVPRGCGYYITECGRDAYASETSCECTLQLQGRLIVCPKCDTVYALADASRQGGNSEKRR